MRPADKKQSSKAVPSCLAKPLSACNIVPRRVETIRPNPRNSRTHSKKQIRQIADSILAHGFLGAIIVDEDGVVLAGHGRLAAAKLLGVPAVPTLQVSGLSEV